MKVTFVFYRYSTGVFDLVQAQVEGNKPTQKAWEAAAARARSRVETGTVHPDFLADVSIVAVLKGLVKFEDRAPNF
jgi:hypothetical protein